MSSLTRKGLRPGASSVITSGRSLGPHFFMRKPGRGFSGKHFLEFGLQVGIEAAKDELRILIDKELTRAQQAAFRTVADSPTVPKAGVRLRTFENISTGLNGINIRTLIFRAFRSAERVAKRAALRRLQSLDKGTIPLKPSGIRRPLKDSFMYRTTGGSRGGGEVSLSVQFLGGGKDIGKVIAQNFGLRPGTPEEAKKLL